MKMPKGGHPTGGRLGMEVKAASFPQMPTAGNNIGEAQSRPSDARARPKKRRRDTAFSAELFR